MPSLSIPATQSQGGDFGIKDVRLFGTLRGTFYLDDIRLVTGAPPTGTAVLETLQDAKPNATALGHNFPNPFNPSTEIRFDIPTARNVKLRVYNQLGQTVRTLADHRMKAGTYALEWDGQDQMGRSVASGVYFYNLEAGDFNQIRKMTLVK